MKNNLKLKVVALAIMMIVGLSLDSNAMSQPTAPKSKKEQSHKAKKWDKKKWQKKKGGCNHGTNVPLDGGILTVLVGGGIAYLVARKKKKQE